MPEHGTARTAGHGAQEQDWCAGIAPTDVTQNRDDWMIVPPAAVTLNGDTECNLIGTSFGAFRDQAVRHGLMHLP